MIIVVCEWFSSSACSTGWSWERGEGIFSISETRKREGHDGFSTGFLVWNFVALNRRE